MMLLRTKTVLVMVGLALTILFILCVWYFLCNRDYVVLVIIYTGDLKGYFNSKASSVYERSKSGSRQHQMELGGILNISHYVSKQLKKYGSDRTILVDTGDAFWGSFESRYLQSLVRKRSGTAVMASLMKDVGYDAVCLGNLEFDYGIEELEAIQRRYSSLSTLIDKADRSAPGTFALLSCNTIRRNGNKVELPFNNIVGFRTAKSLVRVAGSITEEAERVLVPKQCLRGIDIANEITRVVSVLKNNDNMFRELSDGHKYAYIDVVLSHSDQHYKIAKALSGQDMADVCVVIPGHRIEGSADRPARLGHNVYVAPSVFTAPIGQYGSRIGKIVISYNRRLDTFSVKFHTDLLADSGSANKYIESKVHEYTAAADAYGSQQIGRYIPEDFPCRGESSVLTEETAMGHFVVDATRFSANTDIALVNSLAIRAGISRGEVRMKDIWEALPFEDEIVIVQLTGEQIAKLLVQNKYHFYNYLHISGIELVISFNKERIPIQTVMYKGKVLSNDKLYSVALTDFLCFGGDDIKIGGSTVKEEAYEKSVTFTGKNLRDAVISYLIDVEPIADWEPRMLMEQDRNVFNRIVGYVKSSNLLFERDDIVQGFKALITAYNLDRKDPLVRYQLARATAKYSAMFYLGYYQDEYSKLSKELIDFGDGGEDFFILAENLLRDILGLGKDQIVGMDHIAKTIEDAELWLILAELYITRRDMTKAKEIVSPLYALRGKLPVIEQPKILTFMAILQFDDFEIFGDIKLLNACEKLLCESQNQSPYQLSYLRDAYFGKMFHKRALRDGTYGQKAVAHYKMALEANPSDPLRLQDSVAELSTMITVK